MSNRFYANEVSQSIVLQSKEVGGWDGAGRMRTGGAKGINAKTNQTIKYVKPCYK